MSNWPFDDPPNVAVFTQLQIIEQIELWMVTYRIEVV